jgi:hypothetical protein
MIYLIDENFDDQTCLFSIFGEYVEIVKTDSAWLYIYNGDVKDFDTFFEFVLWYIDKRQLWGQWVQ